MLRADTGTNSQTKKTKKKISPREIAERCIEQSRGDTQAATLMLEALVYKDARLYQEVMNPFVREACYSLIRSICRMTRTKIWENRQPTADESRSASQKLADGVSSSYLMFPLPGGKYLRDAIKSDVHEASEFYSKQANNMSWKSRWLHLIELKLPNDRKRVGAVLDESSLALLHDKARGE